MSFMDVLQINRLNPGLFVLSLWILLLQSTSLYGHLLFRKEQCRNGMVLFDCALNVRTRPWEPFSDRRSCCPHWRRTTRHSVLWTTRYESVLQEDGVWNRWLKKEISRTLWRMFWSVVCVLVFEWWFLAGFSENRASKMTIDEFLTYVSWMMLLMR